MDSFSSEEQEVTEPFDEKIDLFDQLLNFNKTPAFRKRLADWLKRNEDIDEEEFLLAKALKKIDNLKDTLLMELRLKRDELVNQMNKNEQVKTLEDKLSELKQVMDTLENERIYVENQAEIERNKAEKEYVRRGKTGSLPYASEETLKRLQNVDRAITILEGDIYNLEMQIEQAKCQLCKNPAQFVCSIYYCGEDCQRKHFSSK
jgi:predicted RNase H-like nuclease (RuvC/YqgF family)